jgi:hypothetical protein
VKTEWKRSDDSKAKYLGVLEFQDGRAGDCSGEWHVFEILELPDRLLFGGMCNVGFIESGYILREEDESTDHLLQELLEELETYYRDGARYTNRIVCNERM